MIGCLTFAGTQKLDINHALRNVAVDEKVIALTFDDGPDGNGMKYAKLFKDEGVKATFFVKGSGVDKAPNIVKALHDAGMEIGNHSYTHANQTTLGYEKAKAETVRTQEAIKKAIGVAPKVYRAPGLKYNQDVWNVLTELQLPAINASSSTSDWNSKTTAEQIYTRAAVNRKAGDIILMHSWQDKTFEVMPRIIKTLKDEGFKFVTVSELLAMSKKPIYTSGTVELSSDVEQLIDNPTLVDADGDAIPDGWWRPTQKEGTVFPGEDSDGRYIRLGIDEPGVSSTLRKFVVIPEGTKEITVTAKIRYKDIVRGTQGWNVGSVQAMFENSKGKKTGDYISVASVTGTKESWKVYTKTLAVPEDAKKIRFELAVYDIKKGYLDIAWITAAPRGLASEPAKTEFDKKNGKLQRGAGQPELAPLPEGTGPIIDGVKGVKLAGDNPLQALLPYRDTNNFNVTYFQAEDMPFKDAVRVQITKQPNAIWDMQLRAQIKHNIRKGDIIYLTFWAKGLEIDSEFGECSFMTGLELNRAPWSRIINIRTKLLIERPWRKIQRVYKSNLDLSPETGAFSFQFGLEPQTFEIGGIELYNYGQDADMAKFPVVKPELYAGHEPDHPWRAEAAERIEKIRKADLQVQVVDASGKPIRNANVKIEMTQHEFAWGCSAYLWFFYGDFMKSEKNAKYVNTFKELFNTVVAENGLKWSTWEQERARKGTESMMKWAAENDIKVRGHTVVWPSFKRSPTRLEKLKNDPKALEAEIEKHIDDIIGATKGKIYAWDVMNEPTTNWEFMQILGNDAPAKWFKRVHELDPNAKLFLNENQIIAGTKIQNFERWINILLDNGAPLQGLGAQGHLGVGTASPMKMYAIFNRLAKYNLPIEITELDVLNDDEELQAMYLRDLMITCFSHSSIESIIFWGFWDGRHWKENTPLYNKDWTPKKGLKVYKDLVFGEWWTNEQLKTDSKGVVKTRGFKGKYDIIVTVDGVTKTEKIKLSDGGKVLKIQL
jgi:GH35 family endo-1,4-beta-xylanase/peptidoglycan/xylan/chitin deacetylase (PgdA/CDA1 family)